MNQQQLQISNTLSELEKLQAGMQQYFQQHRIADDIASELMLVSEELVVNIINYGYQDQLEHTIEIALSLSGDQLSICFSDDAMPFNPLGQSEPELGLPAEEAAIATADAF